MKNKAFKMVLVLCASIFVLVACAEVAEYSGNLGHAGTQVVTQTTITASDYIRFFEIDELDRWASQ